MGWWRNIFGPSQAEAWGEFAASLGGEFIKGGWFTAHQVRWPHGDSVVLLDTYTVSHGKHSTTYTRIRATLIDSPGFDTHITKRGFFSGVGDVLGMQRIAVGDPQLDEKFVIKGKPEEKVMEFYRNADMAAQIVVQPNLDLKLHVAGGGIFGGATFNELLFIEVGVIKDMTRLKQLFALFALSIDRIREMNSGGIPA